MVQTSNLFFPRPGKSKRLRLPICFFPAREKAKLFQISNLLFPNPGKSNRKSEEQLFLQRGQVTNMTCADLSQDLREPFATAVRAHSKSAFEIRSLTRKRWVFERRHVVYTCCPVSFRLSGYNRAVHCALVENHGFRGHVGSGPIYVGGHRRIT